jgi:hypothetical protein
MSLVGTILFLRERGLEVHIGLEKLKLKSKVKEGIRLQS